MKLHNFGSTPSASCLPKTHVVQVDERIVPAEQTDRNLFDLHESLPKSQVS